MATEGYKRKISAILSADVVGYTRLMEDDESATVRTLEAYRDTIIIAIKQHRGRTIDSPGDNILSEFASVVDAVQCAVEIQQVIKAKNADLPENRKMEFRIGINLGDVIEEGDRIYGDGVNLAARIEGIADPGSIYISGSAYEQIKSKLALGYEDLGERSVKNISEPVRVYRIPMDAKGADRNGKTTTTEEKKWRSLALALAAVLVIVLGSIVVRNYVLKPSPFQETAKREVPTAPAKKAEPSLAEKPSIAVLPFDNMSGDPEQEYFADAMASEIISRLSMNSRLSVISQNSTFYYKGKQLKVKQIGKELGARYVVEGTVQKAGNVVRITVQLINTATDSHIWSQTYSRELTDIFVVQEEIALQISGALNIEYSQAELKRVRRIATENLSAYDLLLRGLDNYIKYSKESNARAREYFYKSSEMDPSYSQAHAWLGLTYWVDYYFGFDPDPKRLDRALELAQIALKLDDSEFSAHLVLCWVHVAKSQYENALAEAERMIDLDPSASEAYYLKGILLARTSNPGESVVWFKKAMRLHPRYPGYYSNELANAYRQTNRYEDAAASLRDALSRATFANEYYMVASNYRQMGLSEKAIDVLKEALSRYPDRQTETYRELSFSYRYAGRYEEAISASMEGISQNRDWVMSYNELAWCYLGQWDTQQIKDPEALDKALQMAEKSVAISESLPWGHLSLSLYYRHKRQYAKAIAEAERMIATAPEMADGYAWLANALIYAGEHKGAIKMAEKSKKLNPRLYFALRELGHAYRLIGRLEEAATMTKRVLTVNPAFVDSYHAHIELAIIYSGLTRIEEAKSEAIEVLTLVPHFSVDVWGERNPMKDRDQVKRDMAALRKAGLK